MRSGSVSTLGIDLTTCMDRGIGMAGVTTFGSPDIGVGDMAIKSGSTAIIECANNSSSINSVVSLETLLPDADGEGG